MKAKMTYEITNLKDSIKHAADMLALQLKMSFEGNYHLFFVNVVEKTGGDSVACSAAENLIMALQTVDMATTFKSRYTSLDDARYFLDLSVKGIAKLSHT